MRVSILAFLAVLLLFPTRARADYLEPDFVSLRAMIANHRLESSAMLSRTIEEESVSNEHKESKEAVN